MGQFQSVKNPKLFPDNEKEQKKMETVLTKNTPSFGVSMMGIKSAPDIQINTYKIGEVLCVVYYITFIEPNQFSDPLCPV